MITRDNGYIVCWMIRYNIGGDYRDKDFYQVFIEHNEAGQSPKEQAQELFNNLKDGQYDYENQEMYTANICQIMNSTESIYLNIKENEPK